MSQLSKEERDQNFKDLLFVVLESIAKYNAVARLDIANWLLEGFNISESLENKHHSRKNITLEIISKWMQALEDLGLLCIMFAGYLVEENRDPIKIYCHYTNKKILNFFKKAKEGLPKEAVAKIYGIKTAGEISELVRKEEFPYFEIKINDFLEERTNHLKEIVSPYISNSEEGTKYGDYVNLYFQTKHGFKVVSPTETSLKIWNDFEKYIYVFGEFKENADKPLEINKFPYGGKDFKDKLVMVREEIKKIGEIIQEIANYQIKNIKNPQALIDEIRKTKTQEYLNKMGSNSVGRNDDCPCDSGKKYKKCCGK